MAWRDQDQAFVVYDTAGVRISTDAGTLPVSHPPTFDVGVGSTGSVGQVPSVASSSVFGPLGHPALGVLRPLRTFVVPDPKLVGVNLADPVSSDPADGFTPHPDYPVAAPDPDVICYFETATASGGGLAVDPSGGRLSTLGLGAAEGVRHHRVHPPATNAAVRSFPLLPTGVLRQLRSVDPVTFRIAETVGVADYTTGTFSAATQAVEFGIVALQHPHVTQVPVGSGGSLDGRCLMVLTRQRSVAGVGGGGPSASLNDVVLYLSDDATFTAPVGPFLVVDALNALERFGAGAWPFRVWCSVPSAVVDRDDLLICFMAEASAVDAASLGDSGANAAGYTGGPAMVRIALTALETAVSAGPVAESTWESTYDSTGRCGAAVPFTPLGPVRIWVVDPDDALTPYQPFLSRFPGAKAADPAVVVAGERGVLTLYFAVLRDDDPKAPEWALDSGTSMGHGIWRGSDFSAVHLRTPTLGRFTGTRGVDFLIRSGRGSPLTRADAPDLVRPSNRDDGLFADPDPFPLPDGTWIVIAGRAAIAPVSPHPTSATVGTVEDAVVEYAAEFFPRRATALPRHPLYWSP